MHCNYSEWKQLPTSIKRRLIKSLKAKNYQCSQRKLIDVKNLLHTGEVTPEFVVDLIDSGSGSFYKSDFHHSQNDVVVHIIKSKEVVRSDDGVLVDQWWYIKFYFIKSSAENNIVFFISVHLSD